AHELARVPRYSALSRPSIPHLARHTERRFIALIVDGQPSPAYDMAQRWAVPIDVETGALGELQSLGSADLADRATPGACFPDNAGWVFDGAFVGAVSVKGDEGEVLLESPVARIRVAAEKACIEGLSGSLDASHFGRVRNAPPPPTGHRTALPLALWNG